MSYQYDSTAGGNYGIGHRTQMTDPSGSTAWTYDQWGRVIQKTQTTGSRTLTTAYAYDAFGRLVSQTYPSGRQITYGYTNGQLTSLSLDGQPLISQVLWQPFGPPAIWTRPDGTSMVRSFDLDNQLIAHTFGAGTRGLGYDANGRVSTIQEPGRSISLSYDALDRLVSETLPSGNTGAYTYDANGNRTSQSGNASSSTYGYQGGTNRLLSISGALTRSYSYDGAGNIVADGQHSYSFDATNRLSAIDGGQTQYRYNGVGQRVQKTGGGVSYLAWDEAGQVIGEYDGATTVQETVYLGNLPVAMIKAGVAYSIDTDQIGAPRVIRNLAGQEVWRWDTDAFGAAAANANPSGLGPFTYNPRLPGQFFDVETGKHYNGFRDYDPVTGRYVQSDPIGLGGGINTYTYVGGNPVSYVDPKGLNPLTGAATATGAELGTMVFPGPGTVIGAGLGFLGGYLIADQLGNLIFAKPPDNAYDPYGPKAPGKPTPDDGFEEPKGGDDWVPNPNPGRGGSSYGWKDAKGDVWCPTGQRPGRAHGGPGWDVQSPGGGYRNVWPKKPK